MTVYSRLNRRAVEEHEDIDEPEDDTDWWEEYMKNGGYRNSEYDGPLVRQKRFRYPEEYKTGGGHRFQDEDEEFQWTL